MENLTVKDMPVVIDILTTLAVLFEVFRAPHITTFDMRMTCSIPNIFDRRWCVVFGVVLIVVIVDKLINCALDRRFEDIGVFLVVADALERAVVGAVCSPILLVFFFASCLDMWLLFALVALVSEVD